MATPLGNLINCLEPDELALLVSLFAIAISDGVSFGAQKALLADRLKKA